MKYRSVFFIMLVFLAGAMLLPWLAGQVQETSTSQAESHKIWPREDKSETPLFTISAGATALVVRGPGEEWIKILPGESLEVGQGNLSSESCSVTCREPKYACCKPVAGCKCRDATTEDDTDCTSGGKSASACSLSTES